MSQSVDSIMFQLIAEVNKNPEWRVIYDALMAIARPTDQLRDRTGGGIDEIEGAQLREQFPWQSATATADGQEALYAMAERFYTGITAVPVNGGSYTATDNTLILARYGAMIFMPPNPCENSDVYIRNDDGSCIKYYGNGKTINGDLVGDISVEGSTLRLHYVLFADKWVAI